jgi:hypothetical protein
VISLTAVFRLAAVAAAGMGLIAVVVARRQPRAAKAAVATAST